MVSHCRHIRKEALTECSGWCGVAASTRAAEETAACLTCRNGPADQGRSDEQSVKIVAVASTRPRVWESTPMIVTQGKWSDDGRELHKSYFHQCHPFYTVHLSLLSLDPLTPCLLHILCIRSSGSMFNQFADRASSMLSFRRNETASHADRRLVLHHVDPAFDASRIPPRYDPSLQHHRSP